MSQAKKDQVVDILANGLMNFVNVTGDKEMMKLATIVLRDVSDVFVEHIKADDMFFSRESCASFYSKSLPGSLMTTIRR